MRADPRLAAAAQLARSRRAEAVWDDPGPRDIHAHLSRPVVLELAAADAYTVLDIGCGNGWFAAALDRCGFKVTGLDHDAAALQRVRARHPGQRFITHDITQPLPAELLGSFDAVVGIDVLDHVLHPRQLLLQAQSALRPGGRLIVTVPYHGYLKNLGLALAGRFDHHWNALADAGRLRHYSRETFLALLADAGLGEPRIETIGRVPVLARAMMAVARRPPLHLASVQDDLLARSA